MKNTQSKREIASAPSAMKMPRITSAKATPMSSTFCWYCLGTENLAMMIRKTNRLSTDREYSVSQPAKNSPPGRPPAATDSPTPNRTARLT